MMERRCYDADELSPRVGCGCRNCSSAREMSLDPRLLSMVRESGMGRMQPSKIILHRAVTHYLMGQLDYGLLHLTIIKAMAEQLDKQFEDALAMANMRPARMVWPVEEGKSKE